MRELIGGTIFGIGIALLIIGVSNGEIIGLGSAGITLAIMWHGLWGRGLSVTKE